MNLSEIIIKLIEDKWSVVSVYNTLVKLDNKVKAELPSRTIQLDKYSGIEVSRDVHLADDMLKKATLGLLKKKYMVTSDVFLLERCTVLAQEIVDHYKDEELSLFFRQKFATYSEFIDCHST